MGTPLSSPRVMDDLSKWEVEHAFTRAAGQLKGAAVSALTIDDPVGYPLISDGAGGFQLAVVGDEADVIALILQGPPIKDLAIAALTDEKYLVLTRGPAIVNEDAVELADGDGVGEFTLATIKTALEARSIRFLSEPVTREVQTV